MVFMLVYPFLKFAGYTYVKSSRFTSHDIDIVSFHGAILAITTCSYKEEHRF